MAKVSYSQYSQWSTCPQQYKLGYVDGLREFSANIHTIFGTAMHETIQHFLKVMYTVSKKEAMEIDTDSLLLKHMRQEFTKENDKLEEGKFVCSRDEMEEFYGDGRRIINWLKKKLNKFYKKTGYELVAIELPLNAKIKEGAYFIGYIDVIIKDLATNEIIIIDLKTSTRGWNKYQKRDKTKNNQLLIYKKFYSEKYNVPLDKIRVEFQILRRKLYDDAPFPIPRVSRHVPANGKPSMNKAEKDFMEFVDTCFDENGRRTDIDYPKVPGKNKKNCKWCEFMERGLCDGIPS